VAATESRYSAQHWRIYALQLGWELHWPDVARRAVWRLLIVFLLPVLQIPSGVVRVPGPVCIQGLVGQSPVDTFHLSVLHGFAQLNVEQVSPTLAAPLAAEQMG
jgi:hypothetical protein